MKFDELLHRMGDNLRRARWATGMTQEQVAARGISYRYYQELERGQRNPTLRTLSEIAEILGTTVAALVETGDRKDMQQRTPLSDLDVVAPRRGRKPKRKPA
jgi:transcriptional regulator with XRE-family HTH domain